MRVSKDTARSFATTAIGWLPVETSGSRVRAVHS